MTAASGALIGAAAPALPSDPDVVVIGAGAAGIAATRALLAGGWSVVAIEAADRLGGRAWTESDTFGFPFDRGCAELQGPADLPWLALARERGFTLVRNWGERDELFVGGRRATAEERRLYRRAYDRIEDAVEAHPGDVPIAAVIPPGLPMAATAATWIGPLDFGADLTEVSTADFNAYGDYEANVLVREGYGALVALHGEGLPVRLGVAATAVDWSGEGVAVETTAGTIRARACIVTVSTGVLAAGAIRFTPSLPPEKEQAIHDLPMGLLTKIPLSFGGERFGLSENALLTRAVEGPLPAEACFFLTFPAGADLMMGYVGGRFGWELSAAGEAAAIDFALGEVAGMLGSDVRRRFVRGAMTGWASNPLTRGAYAVARPGRFGARAELARPLGDRVFFAGEAMAVPFAALCSGAHLSGERAAAEAAGVLAAASCRSCDARRERLRAPLAPAD